MKNKIKKIYLVILLTISLVALFSSFSKIFAYSYNGVAWDRKMISGKDIYYWVDSTASGYASNINEAKKMLRYPSGMWNPIVLNKTTTKSYSKIDYYRDDESGSAAAGTLCFRPKENGVERPFNKPELKDSEDWQYAKVFIHQGHFNSHSLAREKVNLILLHETCHAYGGRDVYANSQKGSIMYGYYDGQTATGLSSDFNQALVDKYNY